MAWIAGAPSSHSRSDDRKSTAKGNYFYCASVFIAVADSAPAGIQQLVPSSNPNSPGVAFKDYCWSYDAFGNRTAQDEANTAFPSGAGGGSACETPEPYAYSYNARNQISGAPMGSPTYDAAGDVSKEPTLNGTYQYLYDAEGRICAFENAAGIMTGYIYDAEGNRVAKGTITQWSCNPSSNGFTSETDYVLNQANQPVTELTQSGSTMQWQHTDIWADGQLIATYYATSPTTGALNFFLNDWLGSRRAMTNYAGVSEQLYSSLPYGEQESGTPTPTEQLFTGKERDAESGNDYFTARYYGSSTGRFLSPDPSGLFYADPDNPQSMNLYDYVLNNPLIFIDPTGRALQLSCYSDPDTSSFTEDGAKVTAGAQHCTVWDDGIGEQLTSTLPQQKFSTMALPSLAPNNDPCSSALSAANRTPGGVARANAAWSVLQGAASAHNIPTALLAAIGVRETDFMNVQEYGGGPGMGVFQLTNQQGVTAAQAFNVPFAANYAANMLSSNMSYLSNAFSFTPTQLTQATAASYNFGLGNISGNPNTIDVGTTGGNYGSTVVNLMGCFSHP